MCNALAGAGKSLALAQRISSELTKRKIHHSVFRQNWPAGFNDFTDVWISGGDGTVNFFVNQYPGIRLPLVIFNGGTANDFYSLLYGKNNFDQLLQIALQKEPRPIDLGKCNERYFLNNTGIGFDAEVTKALLGKKKLPGKASFMITVIKKIFTYRSRFYRLSLDDDAMIARKCLMINANNGNRSGGGFYISPEAKADDGLLDVVVIKALHTFRRLRWLPVIERGKHLHRSFIFFKRAKKIVVESDSTIEAHLDGEFYTAMKMEIEILPGKLLIRY